MIRVRISDLRRLNAQLKTKVAEQKATVGSWKLVDVSRPLVIQWFEDSLSNLMFALQQYAPTGMVYEVTIVQPGMLPP